MENQTNQIIVAIPENDEWINETKKFLHSQKTSSLLSTFMGAILCNLMLLLICQNK